MNKRLFSSVNSDELRKFAAIGKQWWNSSSDAGASPLHQMNPIRVNFIRNCLATKYSKENAFATEQLRGIRIIDVGSGGGLLAESLARLGASVTAIDPSQENIAVATAHSKKDPLTSSINYQQTTIENMASTNQKFDVLTVLEVIEHVDRPLEFLSSCSQCLEPGGSLFLSTINRSAASYLMTIVAAEYLLQLIPVGTHHWKKYIKPEEVKLMLESPAVGMKVDSVAGLKLSMNNVNNCPTNQSLNPLSKIASMDWKLSKNDTNVNYILHAIKR